MKPIKPWVLHTLGIVAIAAVVGAVVVVVLLLGGVRL